MFGAQAADVYAFGVMLWEMFTSSRAWAGMMHAQVMCQIAIGARLAMPDGAPPAFKLLLRVRRPSLGAEPALTTRAVCARACVCACVCVRVRVCVRWLP